MRWPTVLAIWVTAALLPFALKTPRAQFNGCTAGFCSPAVSTVSYSGPGDITSGAIAFYSAGRAYNLAYAQALSAAADVVDTATGLTTCTFHFLATGFVNKTECNATACATACSVTKLYDQTGTGNHVVQATLANMPGLTFNAQNGLPCATFSGGSLASAGTISQAAPYSAAYVGKRTANFASANLAFRTAFSTTNRFFGWANVANRVFVNFGTQVNLDSIADSAVHAAVSIASSGSPLFAVDSSSTTSTSASGTTSLSSNISMGGNVVVTCEAGIWPADLNSSYQAMLANMRSATVGWNF